MKFKIPLAWLQLAQQRGRFLIAIAGMAFIVLLMFMQLGFQDALYSSATSVHQRLRGDIFLVSNQYQALTSSQYFPRYRLFQTLGINGVDSVSPLYLQFAKFKNPITSEKYPIYVIGFEPGRSVINLAEVEQNIDKLKISDMALFDRDSRSFFGPIAKNFKEGKNQPIVEVFPFNDLIGYRVRIAGLFSIGPSFGVDGNLLVSDSTFMRIFPNSRPSEMIDLGAINLKAGADQEEVLKNIKASLSSDVKVFTKKQFIQYEKTYWSQRTPIGFILQLMLTMGAIVGVVIVYQILYSNISSQFIAYATLKAIGYENMYLLNVVFQQALILAVLGYIPGFALSLGLYKFAGEATNLPIVMTLINTLLVLFATICMCLISGALAIKKLRAADPADIF